jgi:peptidoglycan-associated lipoprotein
MRRLAFLPLLALLGCKSCGKKPPAVLPPPEPVAAAVTKPVAPPAPPQVQQLARNFERVFFNFDSAELAGDSKAALQENAAILQQFTTIKIEVQGHADERGTTDYNLALGQKRAQTVTSQLQALGVSPSRLKVVSYGEEKPLDGTGSEVAWSQNRRAEFKIVWAEDAPVRGTTE